MAVIRPLPQKPMRTAEGYIPREQLNTACLMKKDPLNFPNGVPPRSGKPLPLPTQAVVLWCSPGGGKVKWYTSAHN
jgi:hypothetical protein